MTLLSLDPAVTSEDNGKNLDPELDLFNPANGYDPEGSTYSDEFIRKYQKAQGERNNRLIDAALERLHALESGKGKYADDEPFIVPGGAQNGFNNKLFPQDIRLLSRTRKGLAAAARGWIHYHSDHPLCPEGEKQQILYRFVPFGRNQVDRPHLPQLVCGADNRRFRL